MSSCLAARMSNLMEGASFTELTRRGPPYFSADIENEINDMQRETSCRIICEADAVAVGRMLTVAVLSCCEANSRLATRQNAALSGAAKLGRAGTDAQPISGAIELPIAA